MFSGKKAVGTFSLSRCTYIAYHAGVQRTNASCASSMNKDKTHKYHSLLRRHRHPLRYKHQGPFRPSAHWFPLPMFATAALTLRHSRLSIYRPFASLPQLLTWATDA